MEMRLKEILSYKKFCGSPKVCVIEAPYFGYGEAILTMADLRWDVFVLRLKNLERGSAEFLEKLLYTISTFRPDFVFTINHFGFDKEGRLASIFSEYQIILVSWFLDNPFYIMEDVNNQAFETLFICSWDSFYVSKLEEKGFKNVFFMPHGYNPKIFYPSLNSNTDYQVSFVGNSMAFAEKKLLKKLSKSKVPDYICQKAYEFATKRQRGHLLEMKDYEGFLIPTNNKKADQNDNLVHTSSLTIWEATKYYRIFMLSEINNGKLTIFGDKGWKGLLNGKATLKPPVSYYKNLRNIYQASAINLNLTSFQMPKGVNQRVFDVPGSGGFLLTDYQEDLEILFDTKKEVAFFKSKEEMISQIDFYLRNESLRNRTISNCLERIRKEHTLQHRFINLYKKVKKIFG